LFTFELTYSHLVV